MGTKLVDRLEANEHGHAGTILSPYTYNTTPLHVFLMHTPWSPISGSWVTRFATLYDIGTDKPSLVAESVNMVSSLHCTAVRTACMHACMHMAMLSYIHAECPSNGQSVAEGSSVQVTGSAKTSTCHSQNQYVSQPSLVHLCFCLHCRLTWCATRTSWSCCGPWTTHAHASWWNPVTPC